ncbi:MAG: dephospho-CoA kinase [Bacteroidota bacterium]
MLKVGLTGGIGSGKSLISRVFSEWGVPVFLSDQEAKKVYLDTTISQQVKNLFGEVIFDHDLLNFKKLAKIVFSDKIALQKLDSIVHPFTMNLYNKWVASKCNEPYTIMESAIIFEAHIQHYFDKIIVVETPIEICIERVMARDSISRDTVLERMQFQNQSSKKTNNSDFTIINDNKLLILPQVLKIHKILTAQ